MGLSRSKERNVERRSTPPLRRPRSAGIPSRPERRRWNDYMAAYEDNDSRHLEVSLPVVSARSRLS